MREIENLYHSYSSDLLGYLRRSFGRCDSPEDMLQETFLQVLRAGDRAAQAKMPRAWLFGVARHVGLTALRRHRPSQPLPEIAAPPTSSDQLQQMREAIAKLPDTMREPLELRLRESLRYEEIAAVLDIPVGTVRSRLHNAMCRLRQAMEAPGKGSENHERPNS